MKTVGSYATFVEAASKFFNEIDVFIREGTSFQWLETTNFLVRTEQNESIGLMTFYEARDFSCDIRLLVEGKLKLHVTEPTPEVVTLAFNECARNRALAETQHLIAVIKNFSQISGN